VEKGRRKREQQEEEEGEIKRDERDKECDKDIAPCILCVCNVNGDHINSLEHVGIHAGSKRVILYKHSGVCDHIGAADTEGNNVLECAVCGHIEPEAEPCVLYDGSGNECAGSAICERDKLSVHGEGVMVFWHIFVGSNHLIGIQPVVSEKRAEDRRNDPRGVADSDGRNAVGGGAGSAVVIEVYGDVKLHPVFIAGMVDDRSVSVCGDNNVNNVPVNIFQGRAGGVGAAVLDKHGSGGDNDACGSGDKHKHTEDRGAVSGAWRICKGIFGAILVIRDVVDTALGDNRDMEICV